MCWEGSDTYALAAKWWVLFLGLNAETLERVPTPLFGEHDCEVHCPWELFRESTVRLKLKRTPQLPHVPWGHRCTLGYIDVPLW